MAPGLALLLRALNWVPEPERFESVVQTAPTTPHDPAAPLTVATWNLQYAGTRRHHYFYDGGPDTFPDPQNVQEALLAIREVLASLVADGLDIALLQEIDRDSDRTARVDELATIALGWPTYVSSSYHKSCFVPHPSPPRRPLGRVDMHQAILARCALGPARRLALPGLAESPLRQSFNLHRAILSSRVPLLGGGHLHVAVTHLSAFSRGDGTMRRQVAALRAWMEACGDEPFVLGGDLNLLPPGDDPARLGPDAGEYVEDVLSELAPLAQRIPSAREHTYLPPFKDLPDRALDHFFVSPDIRILRHRVVPVAAWLSDHWPLLTTLQLPK